MKFLKKLIKAKEERAAELRELIKNSEDVKEVRALGETLQTVLDELNEAKKELEAKEAEANNDNGNEGAPANEGRSAQVAGATFNPMAAFGQGNGAPATRADVDKLSTMEYRTAFMAYVQKGVMSDVLQKRADAENTSEDLGILMPNTIVNEIIKEVEKVHGQVYARVKKTNLKGGVQYPLGAFSATMYWDGTAGTDTEHGVSEKQKGGSVNGFVQFTYHIGEVRIAQSLLQSITTVDAFEKEIVNAVVECYVQNTEETIFTGDGVKQPVGILTEAAKSESRIPAANIITFTAAEMEDWKQWRKKLFAKIPLSMRKLRPEFVMTAETWESNIMTLEDTAGRPVYRETYDPQTGDEKATFNAKEVLFVEEGGIKSFDTAAAGDCFGLYWVPSKAYAVNTNLQFSYIKYFDHNTNQWITKGIVIVDGKVLDPKYLYILKKA